MKPSPSGGPAQSLASVKGRAVRYTSERRDLPRRNAIVRRITAEFQEMPGLVLSLKQASLLLGIDQAACARIFDELAERGVLKRRGRDTYGRMDVGA